MTTQTLAADPPTREELPFWQQRAVAWLDFPLGRLLDYGCGPCGLLTQVHNRCEECHGVDVDVDKIDAARRQFPDFKLGVIRTDGRTEYPDDHFDTVAIVEVIEHVPDERATLNELARVLKPGGRLLLTTPHRGLLTFLDPGNFKFVFPGLHRFVHLKLLRNKQYYEDRFTRSENFGLVGDITASDHRPPWHRHYRDREIKAYCPPNLCVERVAVYFPGLRAFMCLHAATRVLSFGRLRQTPWPLSALERALSRVQSRLGDQLVMLFRKEPTAT